MEGNPLANSELVLYALVIRDPCAAHSEQSHARKKLHWLTGDGEEDEKSEYRPVQKYRARIALQCITNLFHLKVFLHYKFYFSF